ncbi:acyltransferase family protein [Saccharomonospora piscinae]|uniref:acyltransferase family protein n=1 Tax=Saccharomonospora piscinae TaxID=687388 RepID=UPI00046715B5|nr:acyltransferase [Saccharomonospora piscinae]
MVRRTGKREDTAYADPNTGFGWLRLFGATAVVVDHSWPALFPAQLTVFPESWNASPGYLALLAFFAMSGYQISQSWASDPSWRRFCAKRLLRIFPPVIVVVAVTVLVIGPLFTTLSAAEYWGDKQTWRYLVGTSLLFLLQHDLPGVFADNPYPWSVNGSLWTLPMELLGYGLVLVAGLLMVLGLTRWVVVPLLVVLVVADSRILAVMGYHGDAGSLLEVPIGSTVAFLVPFAMGMLVFAFRDRIPLNPWVAMALVPLWLALHWTPLDRYAMAIMACYGAIVWAHHWPKRLDVDGRWIFGSYGMYIWGFPVQQMIIAAGVSNPWVLVALAVPAAYLCGVASWMFVEVPTQRWRRYLNKPARSGSSGPVTRAAVPPATSRQPAP